MMCLLLAIVLFWYYKQMKRFTILLIAALLFSIILAEQKKEALQEQVQNQKEKQTVIEANHFASTTQTTISYDINELQKDKALMFILKPHSADSTDKKLSQNPITITLKQGSHSKKCIFNSYTQLCVIPKVSEQKGKFQLQCTKTPCELSWLIVQSTVVQGDGYHSLDNLVSVNNDKDHAVVKVTCDSPQIPSQFSQSLVLYTNSYYKKEALSSHAEFVWFLFDNEEQGYYYLTSTNQNIMSCANVSLIHMNDQVEFNNQKQIFRDFLEQAKQNTYQFKSIPKKDFRIQADAYDLNQQPLNNNSMIVVQIYGYQGKDKKQISSMQLKVENSKSNIEFNMVYKKIIEKYGRMELVLTAKGQLLGIQAYFIESDVQQIQLGQVSYFDLKKGDTLKYKIIPLEKQISGVDKFHIFPSQHVKVSQKTCPTSGCQFTIEMLADDIGEVYIGEGKVKNMSEIIVEEFKKSVTAKLHPGQQKYYSYKMTKENALQLLVNTPNVVAYASNQKVCPEIDEKCHQVSFNHHFPGIYEPKQDGTLLFFVKGLDSCEFTLTILDENTTFVELKDTQPFTYLFDDQQKQLIFQFKLKEKEDVSFNLIGPLNQLNLFVLNQEKPSEDGKKDWNQAQLSSDGFVQVNKDGVKGLSFTVKVEKKTQFLKKFVHFTIIVSTKYANLHLQNGSPHYQTLKVKDTRDYVFEFDPKERFFLNFYTHNIKRGIDLVLFLSNADQYDKKQTTAEFSIKKYVETIDLALPSKKLCKQNQGLNCELFLRMQNKMDVEVDTTITLLAQQAIIELKDGIWQSYAVNEAVAASHFYFLPKHSNHSATIFYKPSSVDVKIQYNVWKSDDLSLSPSEWPFPGSSMQHTNRLDFKPLQFIHIESQKLKKCWPNCVVLLSIMVDQDAYSQAVSKNQSAIDAHFRIMASNNYIEIPEKHKVDILLNKNQSKELLVDLKYYLQKEQITFYTHHTMGKAQIKANVYSQTNPRCPTNDDPADFQLDPIETTLATSQINKKISDNEMDNDKNVYLCLLASADQSSKFNIEFNTDNKGFRKLKIDTTTTINSTGKQYLYYIDNSQQTYLKISRDRGFPYYCTKLCKGQQIDNCFDSFQQSKQPCTQIANKVTTISQKPCPKCILLIKITTKEQTQLTLHSQSKYNQIELSANHMLSDAIVSNQENRYTLTGTKYQEIIINIQIITGDLKVSVHDFEKVDISRTNEKGMKNIHITIPPKDMNPDQKELGTAHISSFGLSTFVNLHIVVQSQELGKSASYTITYSVGSPVVYLQDGLITQYNLISKKQTKFIYKNPTLTPIYLFTSASDVEVLKQLDIKYYAMSNVEDEEEATQITPKKAEYQKKTVNPTHFAFLQPKLNYFIKVNNNNDHNTLFTVGVNNRQIIYLPFDHEYPIELGPSEYIYIVLNPLVEGYVKLVFGKCTMSHPSLSYTMEYEQFLKQVYLMENQMGEELTQTMVLKVKKGNGLYLRVRSSQDQHTVMSIKGIFSPNKTKEAKAQAGGKGLIQYQLIDSTRAQLTFESVQCSGKKNCKKDFTYTALTSNTMESIYSQLVCPSIMFDLIAIKNTQPAKLTPIPPSPSSNRLVYTLTLTEDIQYFGIKAENAKTGEIVYYQPVEIVTFWGQVHRSSFTTLFLFIIVLSFFVCGAVIIYRRYKRDNAYHPIGGEVIRDED